MAAKKSNPGADRVRFVPDKAQRFIVSLLKECGVPREIIAAKIVNPVTQRPISTRTLARAFKKEIEHSKALMIGEAAQTVMTIMKNPKVEPATRARCGMFYLNTQGGWAHQAAVKPQRIDHFHTHEHQVRVAAVQDKIREIFGDADATAAGSASADETVRH